MAWHKTGFFWSGRAIHLERAILKTYSGSIENARNAEKWYPNLAKNKTFTDQFTRAFPAHLDVTPLQSKSGIGAIYDDDSLFLILNTTNILREKLQ